MDRLLIGVLNLSVLWLVDSWRILNMSIVREMFKREFLRITFYSWIHLLFIEMFKRFQSNLSRAAQLKITSSVCFSSGIAEYVDHLASYHQMHNEAMVIVMLNIVAVMCENTKVYRANKCPMPIKDGGA